MKYNADEYQGFRVTNTAPKKSYKSWPHTMFALAIAAVGLLAFLSPCTHPTVTGWLFVFGSLVFVGFILDLTKQCKEEDDE